MSGVVTGRPPRVLFVSYLFPPVGGVGVQRVLKWVKYLPEQGWCASVLTASNPSVPLLDDSLLKEVPDETIVRRARTREPSYAAKQAAAAAPAVGASRLKSFVKRPVLAAARWALQPDPQVLWHPAAFREGMRLVTETPHDVIVATGPPFSSFLLGRKLSQRSGVPLVLDYRDEWSISNANWEQKRPGRFAAARQSAMEAKCVRAASLILGTTPRGAEEFGRLATEAGSSADVSYVWNGFDADDFPSSNVCVKPDFGGGTDRFRLTFAGTLWTLNSVEGFAAGLRKLATEEPSLLADVELVFAGRRMPDQEVILDTLEQLPCEVRRLGFLPHSEAAALMRTSDALLLPTADVPELARVVCAKTFEYLASGRPIFCVTVPGDQMDVAAVSPSTVCADVGNPTAIGEGLRKLIGRWKTRTLDRGEADLSQFDRRKLAGDLADRLARFAGPTTTSEPRSAACGHVELVEASR